MVTSTATTKQPKRSRLVGPANRDSKCMLVKEIATPSLELPTVPPAQPASRARKRPCRQSREVVGQVEDGLNHCSEQGAEEIACREWKSCWYVPARAPSTTTSSGSTATHCERRHLRPVQCHSRKPPRPEPEGVTAPALNLPLTWLPKTAVRHRNKVGVRLLALSRAPIVAS